MIIYDTDKVMIGIGTLFLFIGLLGAITIPNSPAIVFIGMGVVLLCYILLTIIAEYPMLAKYEKAKGTQNCTKALRDFKQFEANGYQWNESSPEFQRGM